MKLMKAFLFASCALPLMAGAANAQDRPARGEVEEVVVTANKRVERLQDVPQSITAITDQKLRETSATSFQDYLLGVPGVNFYQNGQQTNAFFIRGVSAGVNITASQTAAIYIDEAPVTQALGGTTDLNPYDMERIEVLRGPQGTLYGAGSLGGTIRILLNKPKFSTYEATMVGKVSRTAHGGNNYEINGMANIPLIKDKMALRLTVGARENDGYIDEIVLKEKNVNSDSMVSLRAQLRYQPVENLDLLASVLFQTQKYGAHNEVWLNPIYGDYEAGRAVEERGKQPSKLYSFTANYDFGWATLTSATNYFDKTAVAVRDVTASFLPNLPQNAIAAYLQYKSQTVTQEIRLTSNGDTRLKYVVGAYYQNGNNPSLRSRFFATPSSTPLLVPNDLTDSGFSSGGNNQLAGFAQMTYKVTEQLEAIAGVRVSQFKKHAFAGDGTVRVEANDTFVDQRYGVAYKIDPNHMVFASASSGSRGGSPASAVVNGLTAPCQTEVNTIYGGQVPPLSPDTLWQYEAGTKNSFAGGKFSIDASAYHIDWKDIQSSLTLACGIIIPGNAGAAKIDGAEIEIIARPVDGLTLTASGGYTDTRITEGVPAIGAPKGGQLPLVPHYTGNLSARYELPLTGNNRAYIRGDYRFVDSSYANFQGARTGVRIPSYSTISARAGFAWDRYEIGLFGTNLGDERAFTNILNANNAAQRRASIITPRTVGVDINARF